MYIMPEGGKNIHHILIDLRQFAVAQSSLILMIMTQTLASSAFIYCIFECKRMLAGLGCDCSSYVSICFNMTEFLGSATVKLFRPCCLPPIHQVYLFLARIVRVEMKVPNIEQLRCPR